MDRAVTSVPATLAEGWERYRRSLVPIDASPAVADAYRRAYYAGAAMALARIHQLALEEEEHSTAAADALIDLIDECEETVGEAGF